MFSAKLMQLYKNLVKPVFDFIFSICLLIILSPVIVIAIILLAIANRGSVFFIQQRPGFKGKPFKIIKFKTMKDTKDVNGKLLPDEFRITPIGKFIRSTSVDELLQLINVVKGDMSLIGPRPLLMRYLELYTAEQAKRHDVKPGITGWAQVNGRNTLDWETKFKLDVEYVCKQSFSMDFKIMCMTLANVLLRKGISAEGQVTMSEFMGSK